MEQAAGKRSEQRHKSRVVPFRVSPQEYATLTHLADREGLTVGSYIRLQDHRETDQRKADHTGSPPPNRRRAIVRQLACPDGRRFRRQPEPDRAAVQIKHFLCPR